MVGINAKTATTALTSNSLDTAHHLGCNTLTLNTVSHCEAMNNNILLARGEPLSVIDTLIGWLVTEDCCAVGYNALPRVDHNTYPGIDIGNNCRAVGITVLPLVDTRRAICA